MLAKVAGSTAGLSFVLPLGDGSGSNFPSVCKAGDGADIHVRSGAVWGIPAKTQLGCRREPVPFNLGQ